MKYLLFLILLSSCNYRMVDSEKLEKKATELAERAYFEGQRDAINGDIRIRLNKDSCYQWIKSPWNNGDIPVYNPTYLDTRDGQ